MTISTLALSAKKVIDAAWMHGPSYDLASQAAFALESAGLLMSPDIAEELRNLRALVGNGSTRTVDEDPIAYALTEQAAAAPAVTG